MENSTTTKPDMTINHIQVITWCLAYGLLAIATILGNALTIAIFFQKKLPCKYGACFLINLAVADLMVGALALPMYIYLVCASNYTAMNKRLAAFQHAYTAVDVFTGLASVFTLASIALERLYAVTFPLSYRCGKTKKAYCIMISFVWTIAGTASVAYLLSAQTVFSVFSEKTFVYYLTSISVLSLFVICAAYIAVWSRIRSWNKITAHAEVCATRQEKQLAAALFIVTIVFVLTWSPFHILNILVNFKKSVLSGIPLDLVYLGKLLHYINSLANPAIYSLKILQFRTAVRRMFCKNWIPETRV